MKDRRRTSERYIDATAQTVDLEINLFFIEKLIFIYQIGISIVCNFSSRWKFILIFLSIHSKISSSNLSLLNKIDAFM